MKNSYKIALIFTFLIIANVNSQEKLKGNKDVKIEERNLSEFNIIEVIDNVDVQLVYNEEQSVSVETDSNLQNSVLTEISNGALTIKIKDKIVRKKKLIVHISVNKSLTQIFSYNNSNVISNNTLAIDSLTINTFDNSDVNIKLMSKFIVINSKKTSDLNLEILTDEISIRGEESAGIKGTIDSKSSIVNLIDRASVNITGSTSALTLETIGNSTFKGKNFMAKTIQLNASNSSDAHVQAKETIDIYAKNSTNVYLYGNPKITLTEFFDKATLNKKQL